MRIAVSAASVEEVGCVTIKPHGDDLPVPPSIRSQVISTDRGLFLDITTSQAINDPALELIVTAGCSGAISREYVLLLDPPPLVASSSESTSTQNVPANTAASVAPRAPARVVRPVVRPAAPPSTGAGAGVSGQPSAAPPSSASAPPARTPSRASSAAAAAAAKASPSPQVAPSGKGDALRVTAPPPKAPEVSKTKPADSLPLASTSNLPGAAGTSVATTGAGVPGAAGVAGAAGAAGATGAPGSAADASTAASREQALEKQLQLLSTQVEALREQMRTVNERNRELESKSPRSIYTWILGALALLALALAAWFAWSYRNLQRSSASRPWFEQTQMGPIPTPPRATTRRPPAPREEAIEEPDFRGTDGIEATEMLASDPFGGAAALVRPPVAPVPGPSAPINPPAPTPVAAPARPAPVRPALGTQSEPLARPVAAPPPATAKPAAAPAPMFDPVDSHPHEAMDSLLGISTVALQRTNSGGAEATPTPPVPKPDAPKKDQGPLEAILDIDLSKTEAVTDLRESVVDAMNPLDFELPALNLTKTEHKGTPEATGGQRIIDLRNTSPGLTASASGPATTEHASVQFKLTQFASVVDRAKEMQRSGDPTKAITLLREYVLRDDLSATMIWLMLFDLYRQADKKPVYDALAENFERRYRRSMVGWKEPLTVKTYQSPLALNQELDLKINSLWGTHEGIELLRDLTCGVDQPDRIVFNAELQRDLLQLAKVFPIDDSE